MDRSNSLMVSSMLALAVCLASGCGKDAATAAGSSGSGSGGTTGSSSGGQGGGVTSGGGGGGASALGAPEDYPYDPQYAAAYQRIPAGAALDPNSAVIAAVVADSMSGSTRRIVTGNGGESATVYIAKAGDPVYTVTLGGNAFTSFRAPAAIVNGGGADHPVELLDPNPAPAEAGGRPFTELRLWQATINGMTIDASNGSLHYYNNDGAILNPNGKASAGYPWKRNATGSGLSYLWGMIRPHEVQAGAIRHAIRIAYPCLGAHPGGFVPPALYSDQPNGCAKMSPLASDLRMGQRIQIDPGVDCSARTAPGKAPGSLEARFVRMFCKAAQEYGLIMLDGAGSGSPLVYLEADGTADWTSAIGEAMFGNYGWLLRSPGYSGDGVNRNGTTDGIPWGSVRIPEKGCWGSYYGDESGAACN